MRRDRAMWAAGLCGLMMAFGCKHKVAYDTTIHHPEEFHEPPHEARFDNPPEQGYQKARTKKQTPPNQQNNPGSPGGGMGGMSGPGSTMGGIGGNSSSRY